MTAVLREVRLYGELGRQFGRVHRLAVASAAEAARALCAVVPGFRAMFLGGDGQAEYHVYVGRGRSREQLDEQRKEDPVGTESVIRFVPRVAGAKRQGSGQTILGAVLVAVGWTMQAVGWASGNAALYAAGTWIAKTGYVMVISGVVQMLSPQRKQPDQVQNDPSYGMDGGAFNNPDAGAPVPIAYGRVVVGSVTVSAGLSTDVYNPNGGAALTPVQLPPYMPRYEVDSGSSSRNQYMYEQ